MLKQKLQYYAHLMQKVDSLEKSLKLGNFEGRRRGHQRMASPMQWTWIWANLGRWWRIGRPRVLPSMELQRVGHDWATEQKQQKYTIYYNHATKYEWVHDFCKFGDWYSKNFRIITQNIKFGYLVLTQVVGKITVSYQVIANTLFQQHKRWSYTWTLPDG